MFIEAEFTYRLHSVSCGLNNTAFKEDFLKIFGESFTTVHINLSKTYINLTMESVISATSA